jgi:hypothetical protein
VSWAALLIAALLFSVLMAAWGDLREALMLRVLDARYAKSFLLQFPQDTRVWAGDRAIGYSRPHELSDGEPDALVEGMPVTAPRVYIGEKLLAEQARTPGKSLADTLGTLAPGATVVWHGDQQPFAPVLLERDGRLDYALLVTLAIPNAEPRAFLLRAEQESHRVFTLQREEIWSDQLTSPEGWFWAQRTQYDGFPPTFDGQTKTVWRWYFAFEDDERSWLRTHAPQFAAAPWIALD